MRYEHLFSIFATNKLHVLASVDEHVPVGAGGWSVAVDIDNVNLDDVQQAQYAQEKQEVHLATSDPDQVSDVRSESVEGRQRSDDVRAAVEFPP